MGPAPEERKLVAEQKLISPIGRFITADMLLAMARLTVGPNKRQATSRRARRKPYRAASIEWFIAHSPFNVWYALLCVARCSPGRKPESTAAARNA